MAFGSFGVHRYCFIRMEHKILTSHLSTTSDLRQRRQKIVTSDLKSEVSDAGDRSGVGDTDDSCKSSSSASATRRLWSYWLRLCVGLVVMLVCAWAYANYVKQLHEAHLWFSNIQVRETLLLGYSIPDVNISSLKSCLVHRLCCVLYATNYAPCFVPFSEQGNELGFGFTSGAGFVYWIAIRIFVLSSIQTFQYYLYWIHTLCYVYSPHGQTNEHEEKRVCFVVWGAVILLFTFHIIPTDMPLCVMRKDISGGYYMQKTVWWIII